MGSVEEQIQASASRNRELLSVLSETDYAPPSLAQQNRYVTDLENEMVKLNQEIIGLERTRERELKDHEKYRDSVMKRFAYKMTRRTEKFENKASKEEQEYFSALQEEHRAKETRNSTRHTLDQAKQHKTELETVANRHRTAQKELDDLYDGIFAGPTPGFEDEDHTEKLAQNALDTYHKIRSSLEAEEQVLSVLSSANTKMSHSIQHMEDARSHSRMDMFGGGTITDMMERSALQKAEQCAMEAQMHIMQAQRLSPHVGVVSRPEIAQGNLMSDVFFDNIFTDMAFHEKIKESQVQVEKCAKALDQEGKKAKERRDALKEQIKTEGANLERLRVQLQELRSQAFERVGGSKS